MQFFVFGIPIQEGICANGQTHDQREVNGNAPQIMQDIRYALVHNSITHTVVSQNFDDLCIDEILQMGNLMEAIQDIGFIHMKIRIIQIYERMPHEYIDEEMPEL